MVTEALNIAINIPTLETTQFVAGSNTIRCLPVHLWVDQHSQMLQMKCTVLLGTLEELRSKCHEHI